MKAIGLFLFLAASFTFAVYFGSHRANAGYGDSISEIRVTDHSSYVIDKKFGLCFYEEKDGTFVIQIEGNICEELIHARY